jgi:hypothetical protein
LWRRASFSRAGITTASSAALVVFVYRPGALVCVNAEDGGGVGVAPVHAADVAAEGLVFRRVGDVAALEGGEEAEDFLVVEGAAEAEIGDVVGREVGGVLVCGGAVEDMVGAGESSKS